MNAQLNEQELLVWNAKTTLEACIEKNLRDLLIDSLSPEGRQQLFNGYVLKEHYDCLARKYDILKMSSNIQQQFIQEAW